MVWARIQENRRISKWKSRNNTGRIGSTHFKEKYDMSKRSELKARRAKAAKSKRDTQIIAGVAILVVIAALVWFNLPTQRAQTETPATAQQPAATEAPAQSQPDPSAQPKTSGKQYSAAPPMTIDVAKKYTATFKMAKGGEFVVQLYPDKAAITVNSFVFLARDGYFNGVTFHRVLEGFMAQGGDPTGTGMGGPGYEFVNEDSDLTFDKPGVVAMANAGRDTNGSQFFITFAPTPNLNGGYTIFGQVINGMDVVNGITRRDPSQNPTFTGDVIESISITEE
jgi:cyclophilin family peptidyl-prolyl cis-trans isomerase